MKCYYEVLDVSRDASDGDIKTAYRKLALKWHPDKNLDNPELAKEQFQIVQQAYEVLSDRQERAWYDNHREQILRGSNTEFEDNCLDVFQYFTTSCFKGYDDSEKSFYTVYRNVFEKIAKEDMEFMDDKEEFCEIPGFGNSQSDYASTVGPFYAYWMSYSTKKSYVWLDPYNINETRERRVVKLIEKENKKVRQKAKKERNDEIRSLVAFVRKRDKRVQAYNKQMEEKALENRKKQEKINQQRKLERQKLNESATQAEWAKFDNVKSGLEEIEKHLAQQFGESSDSELDEEDISNLYCPACNKLFKTPKAFENHESSKKHKENVEKLKQQMLEEDELLDEEEEDILDEEDEFLENEDEIMDDLDEINEDTQVHNSDEEELINETENSVSNLDTKKANTKVEEESESDREIMPKQKNKNKKSRNVLNACENSDKEEINLKVSVSEDDFNFASTKKQKKKNKKNNVKLKPDVEKVTPNAPETTTECDNTCKIDEEVETKTNKKDAKTNNSKKRKDKKSKKEPLDPSEVDLNHCCVTCHSNFPSKNKLFDHLKKTGHGVYIPKTKQK